jgi:hypothetical protein
MTPPVALAEHRVVTAKAKDHLGMVLPEYRGQLVRFVDLGEEPSALVCSVIDGHFHYPPPAELTGIALWLAYHAPAECWGSRGRRIAWQVRVAAMVAGEDDDVENLVRDTERPGAIEEEDEAAQ